MLSRRFTNNGKPILKLNQLQWQMKKQMEEKIAKGIYSFEEVPCCICAGKNFETLSEKDRYGLYLPVAACRDCGLVQINPRMTQESYNQFYEFEYWKLHSGKDIPTDEFFKSQYYGRGRRIYSYLSQNQGGGAIENSFVIEVGCAAGGILQYFKEKGNKVYGVDVNSKHVEFGRTNYALNIEVGTIDKVIKLDKRPDIVIYSQVFEHIWDPVAELMKLREVMTQDSLVYIELPGIRNLNRGNKADFLRLLQNAHVHYFTLASLRNIMRKAGFELVCGDEYIHGIFGKSSPMETRDFHYNSDYKSVMRNLRRLEFTRLLPNPYWLKVSLMRVAGRLLQAVGLYDVAKKVYHRFIN